MISGADKDKTISAGQNIIKDTKDYQNKEWSEEKEKINKAKDKINKTKEKVLNQTLNKLNSFFTVKAMPSFTSLEDTSWMLPSS